VEYVVDQYWEEVAQRIESREQGNVIAGDDEPYYVYKRKLSLDILKTIPVRGKEIFELGYGAGGNLLELAKLSPSKLSGADLSPTMNKLSTERLADFKNLDLRLVTDENLPFENQSMDYVFTITVLQHNTNEESLKKIIAELCRISRDKVVISERIESSIKGSILCLGRPVSYYESIFNTHGFKLYKVEFLPLQLSYYVCGTIRKLLNPSSRQEGEPLTAFSLFLQHALMPITKVLDKIIPSKRDLAYLSFERKGI
jgi:ubiquinone/menaquinone biosynthesis C-methylase UbiE